MLNPNLGQTTKFQTTTFGFGPDKIVYVMRNFGDGTLTKGNSLSASHTYTKAGTRTVTQTILLTDGQQLSNIITLYIVEPKDFYSYAETLIPSTLVANRGQSVGFTVQIIGDKITPLLRLRQADPDHTDQYS